MKFLYNHCLFLVLLVILTGCEKPLEAFSFHGSSGNSLPLYEEPKKERTEEGILSFSEDRGSPQVISYRLSEPVSSEAKQFFIRYRSSLEEAILELIPEEDGKILSFGILPTSRASVFCYRIPLPSSFRLHSFRLRTSSPRGVLSLLGAGFTEEEKPLTSSFVDDTSICEYSILNGVSFRRYADGENPEENLRYEIDLSKLKSARGTKTAMEGLSLTYTYSPDNPLPGNAGKDETVLIRAYRNADKASAAESNRSQAAELEARLVHGESRIIIQEGLIGFLPQRLELFLPESEGQFRLKAMDVVSTATAGFKAVPADLRTVLDYDRASWRNKDYEIYSWTLFPGILIMDLADYGIQSAFFKRLAFFVEKRGFAGKILENDELAGRHGWNAHDYKAADLAEFFNTAAKMGAKLNREELLLKEILIENGILGSSSEEVEALNGGIISISRESTPPLREHLLRHEATHGIYFSNQSFASEVESLWKSQSEELREYWRAFFAWMAYDPSDSYLMINEFMAYHLQLEEERVVPYLRHVLPNRLIQARPDMRGEVLSFLQNNSDIFMTNYKKLSKILYNTTGIGSGELACLRDFNDLF